MKSLLTPRKAAALLLLGTTAGGFAASLGPLQGAVLVGRPLSVTATVQLDGRPIEEGCVAADVHYGDAAVAASQVRVSVLATTTPGTARVRISSPQLVDEPVVSVNLRAGCQSTTQRRYVVLAEPVEQEAAVTVPQALAAVAPPRRQPVAPRPADAAPRQQVVAKPPARTLAPVVAVAAPKRERRQPPLVAAAPAPRLQLQMMDGASLQPVGLLRTSGELLSVPSTDGAQRAAAALLWQALNAQPADVLRMGDRMRKLETDVVALSEASRRHRVELERLGVRAPGSPSTGSPWPWLGAALAAIGLTAALLLYRSRRAVRGAFAGGWTGRAGPQADPAEFEAGVGASEPTSLDERAPFASPQRVATSWPPSLRQPSSPAPLQPQPGPAIERQAPADLVLDDAPSAPRELAPLAFDVSTAPPPARKTEAEPTTLKVMVLSEALQEAEFLVSLGYPGKAIDVLRGYVDNTRQPSALACLELLHLCRESGDRHSIAAAESDFRRLFGEEPPRADSTSGLEVCGAALAKVTAAWPRPQVLNVLEELLFSAPVQLGGYPSLHAWRDLLWLHDLARDTLRGANDVSQPGGQDADPCGPELSLDNLAGLDVCGSAARPSVDLDLSDVSAQSLRVHEHVVPQVAPPRRPEAAPTSPSQPEAKKPHAYEDFFEAAAAAEGRGLYVR